MTPGPEIKGARWWKVDFHTHTPASMDYGKGPNQATLKTTTPRQWLLDYMLAGIDAVVVTDHNTGDWVDLLKSELVRMESEHVEGFRKLVLFPGVELTANGGTHVLAVFPPTAATSHIDHLLGACGFTIDYKGTSDQSCGRSVADVVEAIASVGAIPILAHVDIPTGAFVDLPGNTRAGLVSLQALYCFEQRDPAYSAPADIQGQVRRWTRVLGSDSHHRTVTGGERFPGSHYTWVKMEAPDLDGLKLALLDGNGLSIYRSDEVEVDLNKLPELWIEHINVSKARLMGNGRSFQTSFSPKLNAIIGGRGTGKSTLLEFMRMAFDRSGELPPALQREFEGYFGKDKLARGEGAYRPDTSVKVVIWKDGRRLSLDFQGGSNEPQSYYWDGAKWEPSAGTIQSRFPVSVYSQKQIYNMATHRLGLLRRVDEREEVAFDQWKQEFDLGVQSYLQLRAEIRALKARLATRPKLQGELEDVKRKLEVFEKMGHEVILKEHAGRQSQRSALTEVANGLEEAERKLARLIEDFLPPNANTGVFDPLKEPDQQALELISQAEGIANEALQALESNLENLRARSSAWVGAVKKSKTLELQKQAEEKYKKLTEELAKQGVANLQQYGQLVQRRTQLTKELQSLDKLPAEVEAAQVAAKAALTRLEETRREITDRRQKFIHSRFGSNPAVRIRISPFSLDPLATETQWRELLVKPTSMAEPFISADGESGMIGEVFHNLPADAAEARRMLAGRISDLKREVNEIVAGANPKDRQSWLLTYFRSLPPETLDRVQCWWPEDNLEIDYAIGRGKAEFRPIQQGSPGQKTAGILAFLLAFGDEPMILDQPEDDLDNQLIYDLIVSQLRENKTRRQVIIVTHNPNIVVNGDAEYVIPLDYRSGQSVLVDPPGPGSLQSRAIRDEVCRVMEGGRDAFDKRYRRLALEGVHV